MSVVVYTAEACGCRHRLVGTGDAATWVQIVFCERHPAPSAA